MTFKTVSGGFAISPDDLRLVHQQRAITKQVNDHYIQVGAAFLAMSGKAPIDKDWFERLAGETNLQQWIDDPELLRHNVGFNLQAGWMDLDIDSRDAKDATIPSYNEAILAALDYLRIDTRFRFGRREAGVPTHVFVSLSEAEAPNFDDLKRFEPKMFALNGCKYHTQIRSYSTNLKAGVNVERVAKQTVVPGSIYTSRKDDGQYDLSVWYNKDGSLPSNVTQLAGTTPRRTTFNEVVRAITYGTCAYILADVWTEGNRQNVAHVITGWLARVVNDSAAMNNHEGISQDVFCPIDTDAIAEDLLYFVCGYLHDDEAAMRVRAYRDAQDKIARNPDAKVPGWPAVVKLLGQQATLALRTVFMPGSDVSGLTRMAEKYLYNETNNYYIDRERHEKLLTTFEHPGADLERRHKGDVIFVGGKPREVFRIFESSDMRKRVDATAFLPDVMPGIVIRVNNAMEVVPDDAEETSSVVFNTWRGWPIPPAEVIDDALMERCVAHLDQLLKYLTQDNEAQADWVKQWMAWTFQHPGQKQQIAWVNVGGQGVGKSFFGNVFAKRIQGYLWGSASSKIIEGDFNISAFKDKMFVFIDEARFTSVAGTEEIKKLVRNVDHAGQEKYEAATNYQLYSRLMFASNRYDMNIGQANVKDRALFYTKAYDHQHLGMSETEFREWAETIKPFFDDFNKILDDRDALRHFVHYFMHYPADRHHIESIRLSSSNDPEIVTSNMSWQRRAAKYLLEQARIYEDIHIDYPFEMSAFNRRVGEVAKELGFKSLSPVGVFSEYQAAGLIENIILDGQHKIKFKYKAGTAVEKFGQIIGAPLEPRIVYGDEDQGLNDGPFNVPPPLRYKPSYIGSTKF